MTKLKEHSREICYTFTPLFSFFILLINMVFLHPKGHFDGLSTIHRTGETQLCVGDNIAVHTNIGPPLHLLHQYDYLFLLADHQHHLHHRHHHCMLEQGSATPELDITWLQSSRVLRWQFRSERKTNKQTNLTGRSKCWGQNQQHWHLLWGERNLFG